jgi:hypothetical protein
MATHARALVSRFACGFAAALALAAPSMALAQTPAPAGVVEGRQVAVASPPAQLAAPPPSDGALSQSSPQKARTDRGDAADAARDDPQGDDLGDGGPSFKEYLRLHAGPLSIEPEVLMQVQAMPYVGSDAALESGDAADRPGLRFRRARFGFEGRLFHRIPFEINAEFNADVTTNPGLILHDAWFGYDRLRFLQIFVGTMDVPFSRSALTGAGDSALIERPFAVRAMSPFHQLGARLEGHLLNGGLNYYLGLFNGLEKTSYFYTGYVENPGFQGNRFEGVTYAGRVTSEPLGGLGRTMEDLHHGKLRIAAGASAFYSNAGTVGVLGLGGDLLLHFRGLHVLGEFLANRSTPTMQPTQPTNQSATITSYGGVAEAGYVILKERLGVTARFERIVPNTQSNVASMDPGDSWILVGGASYHILNDFLKAQVDYTHREELHGPSLKNDTLVFQAQLNL